MRLRVFAVSGAVFALLLLASPVAAATHSPTITVKSHPAYTMNPITFVGRHLGPHTWWVVEMAYPGKPGSNDVINLGHHQANRYGVMRFTHKAIGMRGAHFHRKAYEAWVVNLIEPHPMGNEPGPYATKFRMFRGCGCGRM